MLIEGDTELAIIKKLQKDGCTCGWVMSKLGLTHIKARDWLVAHGAHCTRTAAPSLWRIGRGTSAQEAWVKGPTCSL